MTDYSTLTKLGLYKRACTAVTAMYFDKSAEWRYADLYKACQERDPSIWAAALEDATSLVVRRDNNRLLTDDPSAELQPFPHFLRLSLCNPEELQEIMSRINPNTSHALADILAVTAENYFLVKVDGQSMLYSGIHSGDYVLVRQAEKVPDDSICLVQVENQFLVKRVHYGDCVEFHSDNVGEKYGIMVMNNGQPWQIVGIVEWLIHRI